MVFGGWCYLWLCESLRKIVLFGYMDELVVLPLLKGNWTWLNFTFCPTVMWQVKLSSNWSSQIPSPPGWPKRLVFRKRRGWAWRRGRSCGHLSPSLWISRCRTVSYAGSKPKCLSQSTTTYPPVQRWELSMRGVYYVTKYFLTSMLFCKVLK